MSNVGCRCSFCVVIVAVVVLDSSFTTGVKVVAELKGLFWLGPKLCKGSDVLKRKECQEETKEIQGNSIQV